MEGVLFYVCGAAMLLGSVAMVASRSAVMAACWLIFVFLGASGLFAALNAPFLAVLQVLVYAGAIMVLFLFVIMMLEGPSMGAEVSGWRAWTTFGALAPAAVILIAVVFWLQSAHLPAFTTVLPGGFGQPLRVAQLLLLDYVFAFELISVVMLIAMVGALALGRGERKQPWT
jgi:NADH-quinone oxidoreductase subunit J